MKDTAELANGAYNAYGASTSFKNFQGDPMPGYGDLPLEIRRAWEAAVDCVVKECKPEPVEPMYNTGVDDPDMLQALQEPFVPTEDHSGSRASRFRDMTSDPQATE